MTTFVVFIFLFLFFAPSFHLVSWAHPTKNAEKFQASFSNVGIINGVNASQGEAPYQIGLFLNGSFQCGGSLIGYQTVLSAAHCVAGNLNPQDFTIRYGTLDIDNGGEEVAVIKVIPHPLYNEQTIDYDVSLFHLATPIKKGPNADYIEIARQDPADGTQANVTGWGEINNGKQPRFLQVADSMHIVGRQKCNVIWSSSGIPITDRMICAASATQASCHGDSGGPLVIKPSNPQDFPSKHMLVGVVSFGSPQCTDDMQHPGVYADVANLRDWIIENSF